MTGLVEAKRAARAAAIERRRGLHAAGAGAARQASGHVLEAISGIRGARVVAAYLPMKSEIDPRPAMLALIGLGFRVCAPHILGPGKPLEFREWRPGGPVARGPLGAPSPAEGEALVPEVVLAPLLAFDADGWRLGYGGGYYDRLLPLLPERAARVSGAFSMQVVDVVPSAPHDIRIGTVVTEAGLIVDRRAAP